MNKNYLIAVFLFSSLSLFAKEKSKNEPLDPWFTGPLLTGSSNTIEKGHFYMEPYIFATKTRGVFDANWHKQKSESVWSFNTPILMQYGLTNFMDMTVSPQFYHNRKGYVKDTVFGDLLVGGSFQIQKEKQSDWFPGLKVGIKELLPTGKYDKLRLSKEGTDAAGGGSYATTIDLDFGKLIKFNASNYLNTRLTLSYTHFSDVNVRGVNAYGGDVTTDGRVSLGDTYSASLGFEYTLTRYVNLALDVLYIKNGSVTFRGLTTESMTAPSGQQISFAPAVEYNFNANMGMIGGVWFSGFGKNASNFVSYVFALSLYF